MPPEILSTTPNISVLHAAVGQAEAYKKQKGLRTSCFRASGSPSQESISSACTNICILVHNGGCTQRGPLAHRCAGHACII